MVPSRSSIRVSLALAVAALVVGAPASVRVAQAPRSDTLRDATMAVIAGGVMLDRRAHDERDGIAGRGGEGRRLAPPRVVEVAPDGFDWRDAMIGCGVGLGLVLIIAGCEAVWTGRRNARRTAGS
jgi:hypothetical protein